MPLSYVQQWPISDNLYIKVFTQISTVFSQPAHSVIVEKVKGVPQAHETFEFRFSVCYLQKVETNLSREHLEASD